jgi:hypothetical protein
MIVRLTTIMSEQALPAHIYIDGSYGEGGGRNFRDTVMYATIKALQGWRGKVTINNIRVSRPAPGIKNSLLGVVEFCHQVLNDVQDHGVQDGSLEATFDFSKAVPSYIDTINIDVNGVGSAWLLFLAVHPVLLYTPYVKMVTIHGGTDVFFFKKGKDLSQTLTPPTVYMEQVWVPNINTLNLSGFHIDVNIVRNSKDKSNVPYAIRITRNEDSPETTINCNGLKKWDGCVRYVQSKVSSMRVGVSNPYSKYILPEPDQNLWYDEHFSDMIVPYIDSPSEESDAVSPHHRSAIYVARQFQD